ncbi:MAG: hypothetical protein V8R91_18630 [Butyricimonas faecihominis]
MKKYDNGNVILGILKATGKIDFIQQDSVIHVKETIKKDFHISLKTNNHEKKFINPQSGIRDFFGLTRECSENYLLFLSS